MSDGNDLYRHGSHWVISDRSGRRVRAEEAKVEWNGAVVHPDEYEPRHPQDFKRAVVDRQVAAQPLRPPPVPIFQGPLVTALATAAVAGDQVLIVESSVRFEPGDQVRVMLDNGETFRTAVLAILDAATMTLALKLPWSAAVGQAVVNETAIAPPDIG